MQLPQHLSWIFQRSKVTCIFKKHSTMSFSHRQAYLIEVCYPCFNKACFQQRVEIDFCRVSNVYSDDRYNWTRLCRTYKLLKVGGTSIDSTEPSHTEFQFWCSWMLASWSYSFPNVESESIKDRKIACILGLCSMLLLWGNSRWVIGNFGKLHDPVATCPILVVVADSGNERCHWMSTRSRNL